MSKLAGKKALVTGASRGIGAAIARRLAAEGADIAFTYQRSAEAAQALAGEIEALGRKVIALRADSADPAAVQHSVSATVEQLGGLDILVNNAGIARRGPLEEMALEDIDALLNVNIRAVVLATRAAIPHLPRGGRIVNIGSNLAERVAYGGVTVYSMTKSALVSLTKGLARDLGPRGIAVTLVNPGSTDTDMNPAHGPRAEKQLGLSAVGHYGKSEDIAAAVAFLVGPDATHVTGTSLTVDGGQNA
ncbi:SDR family NAD(P)-dependent oxidoreductase [Archangium lipolyticum]|uniref:SDR family NAD(P)-dependent oxidoreductase n=1 Tax=Archangium lipolyticum TaxID=2970465 RepID=UPI002149D886|nr:3-oxoacyl-ACP reductase family protein [Archangium lipolyticum]